MSFRRLAPDHGPVTGLYKHLFKVFEIIEKPIGIDEELVETYRVQDQAPRNHTSASDELDTPRELKALRQSLPTKLWTVQNIDNSKKKLNSKPQSKIRKQEIQKAKHTKRTTTDSENEPTQTPQLYPQTPDQPPQRPHIICK